MKKTIIFLSIFFINNAFGYLNTQNACGIEPAVIVAQFTPRTYTCEVGYYLPANTDGCRPCPSGYTCLGGTFEGNSTQSQGLVRVSDTTTTMNNACATNAPRVMVAVFVPNTENIVGINWNNNGSFSTTMCTVGDTIDLPPTPTRVGYVFTGWKVKND